jgi:predicted Zn-dependent protease
MRITPYVVAIAASLAISTSAQAKSEVGTGANTSSGTGNAAAKKAISEAAGIADDTISKAMEDELLRSVTDLRLSGQQSPYFVSYLITDSQGFSVYASFGALDQVNNSHYRTSEADVRVGDYKLDSSGRRFFGFGGLAGRRGGLSLDDNYDAIRHQLWLGTDYGYKRAIESLENKKAVLQQKKVEDLPDSMSRSGPVVSMKPAVDLAIDREAWKRRVRDISSVFRQYPAVIDSTVAMIATARTRWFANSEGSINREGRTGAMFGISANGQAKDGMRVADFEVFSGRGVDGLPAAIDLEAGARRLAERIKALSEAKPIDDYRGPILFEKQAAAELFAQALAPRLTNKADSIASISSRYEASNDKIGRRILPKFISVIDDPLSTEFKGKQLKGGYEVDDEGVKAQKVTLVENGYLKTFCSGRTPSRDVKESNGHWMSGSAATSQLFIVPDKTEPFDKLKEKLIELGREEGLDYVLIVKHISTGILGSITPGRSGYYFGGRDIQISPPTLLYKVYVKDGREELVRGATFTRLTHRLFRDICAAGDDSDVYPVRFANDYSSTGHSVVTPSVLVSEIDIERESHETDMPMLLKNSYFTEPKAPRKALK